MTIRYRVLHHISIMSVIGVFLIGCISSTTTPIPTPIFTPLPDQMDKSAFTGIPCAAPCWHGLEVGKSSENDVTSTLSTLTFINYKTIQTFQVSMPNYDYSASAPGVLIEASCANSEKKCLTLAVIDNILTKIEVGLNYEIRADEAIGYLGNPDYAAVAPVGGEIFICDVYLIWRSSRLVLASTFRADNNPDGVNKYCHAVRDTGKVPSSLLISEVRYLSEVELDALLSGTGKFFKFSGTIPDR
jgi:hypothetical protein